MQFIYDAFKKYVVSDNMRVLMVNPLHGDLPAAVIAVMPTCMRFSADGLVRKQWEQCSKLHKQYLAPVIGMEIGKASDGASTRRKPMQEDYESAKKAGAAFTLD